MITGGRRPPKFPTMTNRDLPYGKISANTHSQKQFETPKKEMEINPNINSNTQIKKNAISFDIDFNKIEPAPKIQNAKKETKKEIKKVEIDKKEEEPNENEKDEEVRFECPECGRKFKKEALDKHAPICQKVFQGKREIEISKDDKPKQINSDKKAKGIKKAKWENQSSELRAIIQNKRMEKGLIYKLLMLL